MPKRSGTSAVQLVTEELHRPLHKQNNLFDQTKYHHIDILYSDSSKTTRLLMEMNTIISLHRVGDD